MWVAGVLYSREAITNTSVNCSCSNSSSRVAAGLKTHTGGNAAINLVIVTALVRPIVTVCPVNLAYSSSV